MKLQQDSIKILPFLLNQNTEMLLAKCEKAFGAFSIELEDLLRVRDAWTKKIPEKISLLGISGLPLTGASRINYLFYISGEKSAVLNLELQITKEKTAPSFASVWSYSAWSEQELTVFKQILFDNSSEGFGVRWQM